MGKMLLMILLSIFAKNSKNDAVRTPILGKIYYSMSHITDTIDGSLFKELSFLSYSEKVSLYQSHDRMVTENEFYNQKSELMPDGTYRTKMNLKGSVDKYYTYEDLKQVHRVIGFGYPRLTYLMPDKDINISWKIHSDTRKINDYNCQKATAKFRGREWTAWFCSDFPYRFGPWKLNGLPGLILEAYDSRQQIKFLFNKLEQASVNEFFEPIGEHITTTEVDFEKMRQAYYDGSAFRSGGSLTTTATLSGQLSNTNTRRSVYNNPIDMESKAMLRGYWY